jgi:pimeloyl-ACP methyl ester carboxylesterase
MNHITIGNHSTICVVFAHGWARTHRDFIQVAESLGTVVRSVLIDLPGFGDTPRPDATWGSEEYADHCAAFVRTLNASAVVWVGHSFGGRVGMQLAVRHPDLLQGLILVAGAGIPTAKSRVGSLRRRVRQMQFKLAKRRAGSDAEIDALERTFGSADYVASKEIGLRDIFVKVVSEDQSDDVTRIAIPTTLIYGERDTETPVELGARLQQLIPQSELIRCPEFGHIDILNRGRHQIALSVKEMIREVSV